MGKHLSTFVALLVSILIFAVFSAPVEKLSNTNPKRRLMVLVWCPTNPNCLKGMTSVGDEVNLRQLSPNVLSAALSGGLGAGALGGLGGGVGHLLLGPLGGKVGAEVLGAAGGAIGGGVGGGQPGALGGALGAGLGGGVGGLLGGPLGGGFGSLVGGGIGAGLGVAYLPNDTLSLPAAINRLNATFSVNPFANFTKTPLFKSLNSSFSNALQDVFLIGPEEDLKDILTLLEDTPDEVGEVVQPASNNAQVAVAANVNNNADNNDEDDDSKRRYKNSKFSKTFN